MANAFVNNKHFVQSRKRWKEYHNNHKNGNHFLNARLENYLLVSDPTYVLKKQTTTTTSSTNTTEKKHTQKKSEAAADQKPKHRAT